MSKASAARPSSTTRGRILDAALDLFGERGLNGVTVRDIAARAKVNVAAISYHFGGKEALYRAVAEAVSGSIETRARARMAPLLDQPPRDAEAALAALEEFVATIADIIVGPEDMRRVARFVIREQMQPTRAFEVLFAVMARMHEAGTRLFATAAGLDPAARDTRLRVFMLIGQVIFLRIAEETIRRRLALARYDKAFLARAKALARQNARAAVEAARGGGT